jgi:hypothetical protein
MWQRAVEFGGGGALPAQSEHCVIMPPLWATGLNDAPTLRRIGSGPCVRV